MIFDATITMGAVLNAAVLLVGFAIAFTKIGGRIDIVQETLKSHLERLKDVESSVKQIAANDIRMATIEERVSNNVTMLTTMQRDVSDLRHGSGFITSHRNSVNGEY